MVDLLLTSIGIWCLPDHSIEDPNLRGISHDHHDHDHHYHDHLDRYDDVLDHLDDVDLAEEDSDKKGSSCRISRRWEEERKP